MNKVKFAQSCILPNLIITHLVILEMKHGSTDITSTLCVHFLHLLHGTYKMVGVGTVTGWGAGKFSTHSQVKSYSKIKVWRDL